MVNGSISCLPLCHVSYAMSQSRLKNWQTSHLILLMGLLSGNVQSAVQSMDKEDVLTIVFLISLSLALLTGYVLGLYRG